MKLNKIMAVMVISSALVLSGCSAMGTAIKKRNLDVKTQMSEATRSSLIPIPRVTGFRQMS